MKNIGRCSDRLGGIPRLLLFLPFLSAIFSGQVQPARTRITGSAVLQEAAIENPHFQSIYIALLKDNSKGDYRSVISGSIGLLKKKLTFYPAFRLLAEASEGESRKSGSPQALQAALNFVLYSASENPLSPFCHYGLGLCYKKQRNFVLARQSLETSVALGARFWDVYEELLTCYKSTSDIEKVGTFINDQIRLQPDNPFLYQAQGSIGFMRSDYREALSAMEKACLLHRRHADRRAEAKCLGWMSYVEMYSNDYPMALKLAEESLELARKLGDSAQEAASLELISFIRIDLGDYSRALECCLRALSVLQEAPDSRIGNVCRRTLGVVHLEMGNLAKSRECLERSLEFYVRDDDLRGQDVCLYWLTLLHRERGDFSKALDCGRQALQISREIGFTTGEAFHLTSIGSLYLSLGDYDKALEYNKQALRVTEKHLSKWSREQCLNTIGYVYSELHDYAGALAYFEQALDYISRIGHKREEARCLYNIGFAYLRLEDISKALSFFSQSLRSARRSGNKTVMGSNYNRLGDVYRTRRQTAQAKASYEQARAVGQETGQPTILWESLAGLGAVARQEKDFDLAVVSYKAAVEVIEDIRNQLLLREDSSGFFKNKISLYEELVDVLYDKNHLQPAAACGEECFSYAERAKARSFLDDLQKAKVERPSEAAALIRRPCRLEEIRRRVLDEKTALIEYFIGEKNAFIFLVTKEGLFVERTGFPRSDRLLQLIHDYTKLLSSKDISGQDCLFAGQRLYQQLLTPVERFLPRQVQKLIIIPDRHLYYLPFEALVIPADSALPSRNSLGFLLENYVVSYAPSASSLLHILDRQKKEDGQKDLLAVGDPRCFGSNGVSIPGDDDPVQQYYLKNRFAVFPLLFASKEIDLVSRFFRKNAQLILTQREATERNVKRLPLADFRVIHFATHGLLDEQTASRSALALTLGEEGSEDGFLQAREIYDLRMNASLVVLSACQTALGKMEKGEGAQGIARAFFCAGTRSVLASLWNISDRSTALFMKYFYGYLTKGKSKEEALALAKTRMLHSQYNRPYHWAAFILLGEADAPVPVKRNPFWRRISAF